MQASSRLLLKLSTFASLVVAGYLSHAFSTREQDRDPPPQPGPLSLRAIGAMQPRLAANGKDIAFSYQGNIWRTTRDGGTMRRLAGGKGHATWPCWSDDAGRIAFLQGGGWGTGAVKIVDAATGKPQPLPDNVEIQGAGKLAFTPDGNRLVGFLREKTMKEALRTLDLKTGKLATVRMIDSPIAFSSRTPWGLSPDGKWLVYGTNMNVPGEQAGNDGPQMDLWKVAITGGEPERIVQFPSHCHDVCWTADGKSLIVTADLGSAFYDLWRIDLADPEKPTRLTFGAADEDRPSVSADGRWLLHRDNHEVLPALVLHNLVTGAAQPLTFTKMDYSIPTGRLRLRVRDKATDQPVVARLSLQHKDGDYPAPPGAIWRIFQGYANFTIRDQVDFEVPAGSYTLQGWHGPEYRAATQMLEVKADATTEHTLALERWADPNAQGWFSGDNHIHANYGYGEYHNSPATMADMCAAEGLNVGNFMVANSDTDGIFDRQFFRGRPDAHSTKTNLLYWNEEYRSTIWGHMTLINLKHVVEPIFTGFKDTTNPYDIPTMSEISIKTRRQGGLVNYTHPAYFPEDPYRGPYSARGLPIYTALGYIDTMDVAGSGEKASSELYHRVLNCGIRMAASAGTDCFLNMMVGQPGPGNGRVYVKVEGPLNYEKWVAGLKAGRSFVSNGPQLELTVDGKALGDTLELRAAGMVRIKASASSAFPMEKVEVLHNGKVIATAPPVMDGLTTRLDEKVMLDRSGWIALRAIGKKPAVGVQADMLFAHTSPVYVTVAGWFRGRCTLLPEVDRLDLGQGSGTRPDSRCSGEEARRGRGC